MSYDNELRGVLFRNDERRNDKDPNYKGNITINGQEYWLSAWLNESKSGQKYMALKANPKEPRAASTKPAARSDDFADDAEIPF